MGFTTKEFATEVGIIAGYTISVIWFVLFVEILLKSTHCPEEVAQVQSPKKALMDDITLLTRSQEVMTNTFERLDSLVAWGTVIFKTKKSRSVTFRKGIQKEVKFAIAGESIPTVKEKPLKSLGRWYAGTLFDRSRGLEVMNQAGHGLTVIDQSKLPGKYKIWCLQFCIYPLPAWSKNW